MILVLRGQQRHMLLVLRVQQKHALLVLRDQQTAKQQTVNSKTAKFDSYDNFLIFTCSTYEI